MEYKEIAGAVIQRAENQRQDVDQAKLHNARPEADHDEFDELPKRVDAAAFPFGSLINVIEFTHKHFSLKCKNLP